jgi:hypothetical protein
MYGNHIHVQCTKSPNKKSTSILHVHHSIPMLLQSSGRSRWCWCLLLVWRTVGAKGLDLVRENQGIGSNIIAARQGRGGGRGMEDSSGRILTRKDPVVECVCIHVHVHVHCVCAGTRCVYGYVYMYRIFSNRSLP